MKKEKPTALYNDDLGRYYWHKGPEGTRFAMYMSRRNADPKAKKGDMVYFSDFVEVPENGSLVTLRNSVTKELYGQFIIREYVDHIKKREQRGATLIMEAIATPRQLKEARLVDDLVSLDEMTKEEREQLISEPRPRVVAQTIGEVIADMLRKRFGKGIESAEKAELLDLTTLSSYVEQSRIESQGEVGRIDLLKMNELLE